MEGISGVKHSRTVKAASKGVSTQTSLLTILIPAHFDWDEFSLLPEEIHLTNVAFEVYQVAELKSFIQDYPKHLEVLNQKYDQTLLLGIDCPTIKTFEELFDHSFSIQMNNTIDILIVEKLRFDLAEYL